MRAKDPFTFRNGKVAPNRIAVPAMASQTADAEGRATPVSVAHYGRLAASGAGIVFVEYSFVHVSGKAEPRQLGVADAAHGESLPALARAIKESGCKGVLAGFQIAHAGGKTTTEVTGGPLQSPSGVVVPARGRQLEVPTVMTPGLVEDWKAWFVGAALRVERAGFDVVELHAAHGYGLNQWLSPLTNLREGPYGAHERNRLLRAIVAGIRQQAPGLLISVRIPGQDFLEGGLQEEEMQSFALELEQAGADLINVSSGLGGWNDAAARIAEGFLVPQAAAIQSRVSVPVMGVGGIKSLGYVNGAVTRGDLQFAAVGRAILHDQWSWSGV